jgi:hypothetical protein
VTIPTAMILGLLEILGVLTMTVVVIVETVMMVEDLMVEDLMVVVIVEVEIKSLPPIYLSIKKLSEVNYHEIQ